MGTWQQPRGCNFSQSEFARVAAGCPSLEGVIQGIVPWATHSVDKGCLEGDVPPEMIGLENLCQVLGLFVYFQ